MKIKGLTLIRPWGYAIVALGKDIENRSWVPSLSQLEPGDWLAIHNGVKWGQDDAEWIAGAMGVNTGGKDRHPASVIIGVAQYGGLTWSSKSKWYSGPYGWLLSNPIAIEPIPHKGALGLWTLEPAALEKVTKAIEVAK